MRPLAFENPPNLEARCPHRAFLRPRFSPASVPPWFAFFLLPAFAALLLQLTGPGAFRDVLIYDRTALASGELWRVWTGHLCHFGWFHTLADTAVFFAATLALALRSRSARPTLLHSLFILPAFVSLAIYLLDPAMHRYAGLSGVNVGLLVFLSLDGFRCNRRDWFWPALLTIHAIELLLEYRNGGLGGGAIRFDEPAIRIATIAHLAGATYGALWFLLAARSSALAASRIQLLDPCYLSLPTSEPEPRTGSAQPQFVARDLIPDPHLR